MHANRGATRRTILLLVLGLAGVLLVVVLRAPAVFGLHGVQGGTRGLRVLLTYSVAVPLLLLPGFALGTRVRIASSIARVAAVPIFSAAVGYLAFWAYFASPVVGRAYSVAVYTASFLIVVLDLRSRRTATASLAREIASPATLMLCAGAFYLALLELPFRDDPQTQTELASARVFPRRMTDDNILPKIFTNHLLDGTDPRPFYGDWLSSDRPPLQAGVAALNVVALERVVNRDTAYETCAVAFQSLWTFALWVLCGVTAAAGRARPRTGRALFSCLFVGFFFLNSIYVWPKLAGGALCILAFALLLSCARGWSPGAFILAASSYAGALMAHGSSVFFAPALLIAAIPVLRSRPRALAASLGTALAIGLLWLGPWLAYQHFYDPPGVRLLKWHLAGVIDPDPRPFCEALIDSYRKLGWRDVLALRWSNARVLFTGTGDYPDPREADYFLLFRSFGFLNVGWLVLLWNVLRRREGDAATNRVVGISVGAALVSLVAWAALMFGPATTVVHVGPYGTFILMYAVLAGAVASLPAAGYAVVVGVQSLSFTWTWVLTAPPGRSIADGIPPDPLMIVAIAVSLWGFVRAGGAAPAPGDAQPSPAARCQP